MLASLAVMTLSLSIQGLQITIDNQPQTGLFTPPKNPTPLKTQAQQFQYTLTPPAIIKDTDVYNVLTQFKLLQKVTGHYILNAKSQRVVLPDKKGFFGLEGAAAWTTPNGFELKGGEDIPPCLYVRFNSFLPPTPMFLVIYQVSGLDNVGKDPRVFVGQTGEDPGGGGPGKIHDLKTGAYATLYDSKRWLVAALAPKIESGGICVCQIDVFTLDKR